MTTGIVASDLSIQHGSFPFRTQNSGRRFLNPSLMTDLLCSVLAVHCWWCHYFQEKENVTWVCITQQLRRKETVWREGFDICINLLEMPEDDVIRLNCLPNHIVLNWLEADCCNVEQGVPMSLSWWSTACLFILYNLWCSPWTALVIFF